MVLEKAERLEEVGAGLQLSPNASSILIGLGLKERLAARAVMPEAISIMSARAGREIIRLPLGETASLRAGAPYWVIHRADLQAALQAQVNDHPDIELRLGCQFEDAAAHAKGLTVVQRRGNGRQQDLALALIGADGIWSTVRQHLFPKVQPQFSGLIAWRGTLDATQLPREYTGRRVQLWMGPSAHLVAYPISGGRQINVVAIVPGTWNTPGWSAAGDALELQNAFAASRWPGPARMMINAVDGWRKWALFTLPEGGEWTSGTIGLLGDATHAMLPFAAQGAGDGDRGRRRAGQMPRRGPRRHRSDRGCGVEALRAAAPNPRGTGAAHRTQLGANLPSHRTRRIGARPHDQGLGR